MDRRRTPPRDSLFKKGRRTGGPGGPELGRGLDGAWTGLVRREKLILRAWIRQSIDRGVPRKPLSPACLTRRLARWQDAGGGRGNRRPRRERWPNGARARNASNGGGGGRIAIYTWNENGLTAAQVSAQGGAGAQNGTVVMRSTPWFGWEPDPRPLSHGTERLRWAGLGVDVTAVHAEVAAYWDGREYPIAPGAPNFGQTWWNTASVPDGIYTVHVLFRDNAGTAQGELTRRMTVINRAVWHSGPLTASETWSADSVHLIDGDVTVPDGKTLTLEAGVVVKFLPGRTLSVAGGGTLAAVATNGIPVVCTSFRDDSVDGDTNLDGGESSPQPGEWGGVRAAGGTLALAGDVQFRYSSQTHAGTLAASETWPGDALHLVPDDLNLAPGVTLTIEPGAVIKVVPKKRIRLPAGAVLVARGRFAAPVTFTSMRDDTVAGDSNGDGAATAPEAGDWAGLDADSGEIRLDYRSPCIDAGDTGLALKPFE